MLSFPLTFMALSWRLAETLSIIRLFHRPISAIAGEQGMPVRIRIHLIAPAVAIATALALSGCSEDEGDGPGSGISGGVISGGGGLPGDAGAEDLELETTGGLGDGSGAAAIEGSDDWYGHWESGGITLYSTLDGVLYGNSGTGEVCDRRVKMNPTGGDMQIVGFYCLTDIGSVTLRLNGDTMAIEWDDRTEEVTKVAGFDESVDIWEIRSTWVD
jgi:hypothetical protein